MTYRAARARGVAGLINRGGLLDQQRRLTSRASRDRSLHEHDTPPGITGYRGAVRQVARLAPVSRWGGADTVRWSRRWCRWMARVVSRGRLEPAHPHTGDPGVGDWVMRAAAGRYLKWQVCRLHGAIRACCSAQGDSTSSRMGYGVHAAWSRGISWPGTSSMVHRLRLHTRTYSYD